MAGFVTHEPLCSDYSINEELTESEDDEFPATRNENVIKPKKRACKQILTPRLAAVLDKLKISSRDAVHIIIAVLDAVGASTSDFIINRNSIRQQRDELRKENSTNIVSTFTKESQPLTIHWDTKLLPSLTGKTEDRLSIIATAPKVEHVLNMPDIPSGTGIEIASAIYDTLEENNVLEKTEAFVFDTTAANTGKFKGACNILEKRIGRDILFLGCRHHIFEIVLAAVFVEGMGVSTGPEVAIFKKFKKHWPHIKHDIFLTGLSYPRIKEILGDERDEILDFANKKIEDDFPRSDYKEFLELIIIFLGGTPPRGLKFAKPGAMHLARWMAKAIYCLKILMFQNQFPEITECDVNGLIEVAGFIIKCYSPFWFNADKTEQAPLNDIEFIRKLENYKSINKKISEKAITKFINHLYYLSDECVGFALFDDRLDKETKVVLAEKMCLAFTAEENEDECEDVPKKLLIKQENIKNFIDRDNSSILRELFSKNTKQLLKRFKISTNFLERDPSTWNDIEEYRKGKEIIQSIQIVNDCAERGIKLIQDYHGKITKDEKQRQYLLKVMICYIKIL